MAKSNLNTQKISQDEEEEEEEGGYTTTTTIDDDSDDPDYYSDDISHFKFSNLSINTTPIHKRDDDAKTEINDEEVSVMEELNPPKLKVKDLKSLEDIQRIIVGGQVEKLKLEQCKVYLREHGLRLTGKKDTLVQRIKEHLEVLNGGGEKKYPLSSFVLNCKGDACMGDIVMFEQTVYEGYNIASRSAIGPPCGKRTVAGRIVKESYGAAKQQHTFTVEVLWSKGDKPLPPLHPLLIKGRNLYKLNTLRQRWEDESERHRVLSEKHSRGSLARSNREARIQEKEAKKNSKAIRTLPKEGHYLRQEKNHKHASDQIPIHGLKLATDHIHNHGPNHLESMKTLKKTQMHQVEQLAQNIPGLAEFKEHAYPRLPVSHPSELNKLKHGAYISNPTSQAYKDPNSSLSCFAVPKLQHSKLAESTLQSHNGHSRPAELTLQSHYRRSGQYNLEYKENTIQPDRNPYPFQQKRSSTSTCNFFNQQPRSYNTENGRLVTSATAPLRLSNRDGYESRYTNQLIGSNRTSLQSFNGRNYQQKKQQPCRYYPQGKCYHGDQCRFLHKSN